MIDWEEFFRKVEEAVKPYLEELAVRKYKDPFKVLIAGIISTRTKEEVTKEVSERFFSKISKPEDVLKYSEEELSELLKPCGFYRQKAKYIKKLSEILVKEFNGRVPDKYEDLVKLPGVGNKVAKLVLEHAFGKDYIVVDTHVHRIFNRLGIVKTKTPEETEKELYKIIPKKYWRKINGYLVLFGRHICLPKNPKCETCPLKSICRYFSLKNTSHSN